MTKDKHPAHFVGANNKDRQKLDFYPTPPEAVIPITLSLYIPPVVWEPACGNHAIANVLKSQNHYVYTSDVIDYGEPGTVIKDFFSYTKDDLEMVETMVGKPISMIMTNPPYKVKSEYLDKTVFVQDWIEHGYELGIPYQLHLLKTTCIAGKNRVPVLKKCGLKAMYQFVGRLRNLGGGGTSMIDFAWFYFDRDYTGDPVIKWINQRM